MFKKESVKYLVRKTAYGLGSVAVGFALLNTPLITQVSETLAPVAYAADFKRVINSEITPQQLKVTVIGESNSKVEVEYDQADDSEPLYTLTEKPNGDGTSTYTLDKRFPGNVGYNPLEVLFTKDNVTKTYNLPEPASVLSKLARTPIEKTRVADPNALTADEQNAIIAKIVKRFNEFGRPITAANVSYSPALKQFAVDEDIDLTGKYPELDVYHAHVTLGVQAVIDLNAIQNTNIQITNEFLSGASFLGPADGKAVASYDGKEYKLVAARASQYVYSLDISRNSGYRETKFDVVNNNETLEFKLVNTDGETLTKTVDVSEQLQHKVDQALKAKPLEKSARENNNRFTDDEVAAFSQRIRTYLTEMGLGDRIESINQQGNTNIRVLFTPTTTTTENGTDTVQFGYIFTPEKLYTIGEPEPVLPPEIEQPTEQPSEQPEGNTGETPTNQDTPESTQQEEAGKGEETAKPDTTVEKTPEPSNNQSTEQPAEQAGTASSETSDKAKTPLLPQTGETEQSTTLYGATALGLGLMIAAFKKRFKKETK
ncbi:LPXTG cell wall anchor domain-containing protein [Carnobacteriaceae bacterium zg-ZUI252]|nr:LPXTG cell wall anchor domain-containing protein [Carnobacteriaceae bacterium zg-ZUI252]